MSARRCIIEVMSPYTIRGPLTYELARKDSPVRQFFDDRLTAGLKEVQAAYRAAASPVLVPGVPREVADAGTIGTAADWLMRFLVSPGPVAGPGGARRRSVRNAACFAGTGGPARRPRRRNRPVYRAGQGTGAEPSLLYRACWGLALLTEVYRRGPAIAAAGPLGRLRRKSAQSLLEAAPDAGLEQLAALRMVIESALLPAIGPQGRPVGHRASVHRITDHAR